MPAAVPPVPSRRLLRFAQQHEAPPRTPVGRWLTKGGRLDTAHDHTTHPWQRVLWLTGVDYFSTLGYQPGIALLAAGALSPLATAVLIAVTLAGALPVYSQVAGRSFAGQGSIALLESLLSGWTGKILVLVLLGFAGTDFVITMTLSAADAAQHAIENPFLHPYVGDARLLVTCALLTLLAAVFLKGFVEAIGLAMAVGIPYILLNVVVLARGVWEIATHPTLLDDWTSALTLSGDPAALALAAVIVFPRLALGMSGFETGVSVMPLVSEPRTRSTRMLLAAAALIMSVLLMASSFVTTLLVPREAYAEGGPASGRAIAWLAHLFFGDGFGTLYDAATIAILWFAGASAMAGLLHLIPRYLPRFGMAPAWIAYQRPMVLVLFALCLAVTWVFDADVESQGGAYATGVLVLMLSAALAVAIALWKERRPLTLYFWGITGVFVFTLVDNVWARPDGVIIAGVFITFTLAVSALSRWRRATELRATEVTFADDESAEFWPRVCGKKVHLVPLRVSSRASRAHKKAEVTRHYAVRGPLAFIHVNLLDNRSEFLAPLQIRIRREDGDFNIEVSGAVAIANTIAYVSELIDPISLFLGLTRRNLMAQAVRFLLWGEGETGLMVYAILVRFWEWTPEEDVRPLIFLMSE